MHEKVIQTYTDIREVQIAEKRYCPRACLTQQGGICTGVASSNRKRPWIQMSNGRGEFDGNASQILRIPDDCPFGLNNP